MNTTTDLTEFKVLRRDGRAIEIETERGPARIEDFQSALLPEVWSLDHSQPADPTCVHESWTQDGLVPVALLGRIMERDGDAPYIQCSRIEWEGKRYSWVDCRCLDLEKS